MEKRRKRRKTAWGTRGSETSQYPEEKKKILCSAQEYSLSSGERKGNGLNLIFFKQRAENIYRKIGFLLFVAAVGPSKKIRGSEVIMFCFRQSKVK